MTEPPGKAADIASILEDLTMRPMIFPDEDPATYEGLREALLHDLKPRAPYEQLLAENIVTLEWEAFRHRRMRDNIIRAQARNLVAWELASRENQASNPAVPEHQRLAYALEHQRHADALVGSDPQKAAAMATWEKYQISPSGIFAKAYSEVSDKVEVHEKKLAEIETRRRRLKEEYDRLRAARPRAIEEAEIIE